MSKKNSRIFNVKVNDFEFSFTQEQVDAADIVQTSGNAFNLLLDQRSVNAVLVDADPSAKKQTIEIKGEQFDIQVREELDVLLDTMGFGKAAGKQIKEIKAPMPGQVLEVRVSEGDNVQTGDTLLILVAMKMENSILINTEATIKRITVRAGQAVEKGQVLVELD